MSSNEGTPPVSEPLSNMSANEETVVMAESKPIKELTEKPTEKNVKTALKGYRQKLQAIYARIKYREKAIKGFRNHLKRGHFLNDSNHYGPTQKWIHQNLKLL